MDDSFPLWLPFFVVGLWLLIGAVSSELARWPELAFRCPGRDEPPGRTLWGEVVSVGLVSERDLTILTVSEAGLYMKARTLFRFRRPPILVPWAGVVYVGERKFLWSTTHVFELAGITKLRVRDGAFSVIEPFLVGASSIEARTTSRSA